MAFLLHLQGRAQSLVCRGTGDTSIVNGVREPRSTRTPAAKEVAVRMLWSTRTPAAKEKVGNAGRGGLSRLLFVSSSRRRMRFLRPVLAWERSRSQFREQQQSVYRHGLRSVVRAEISYQPGVCQAGAKAACGRRRVGKQNVETVVLKSAATRLGRTQVDIYSLSIS